jgi:hypothetical protein
MAAKRMFDKDLINQDRFVDLSNEAKLLYFLLGMEADDEGFIGAKKILRVHGIKKEALEELLNENFLIQFESGVVVIVDWNRNNYLQRKKPTLYVKEKSLVELDSENKTYLFKQKKEDGQNQIDHPVNEGDENMNNLNNSYRNKYTNFPDYNQVGMYIFNQGYQHCMDVDMAWNYLIEHKATLDNWEELLSKRYKEFCDAE